MAVQKFDLINQLIADGFDRESHEDKGNGYARETFTKSYSKPCTVAWYGESVHSFDAEIQVIYYLGEPVSVYAFYSNGKRKQHEYNKRAYNAIRDTIKNNGFEI